MYKWFEELGVQQMVQFAAENWRLHQITKLASGGKRQGGPVGHSPGVLCGLSSLFNFLSPWSQFELPKYVRLQCIISFACFVIPLYLKQMKHMALKQIDSSWNEKDLYPSECWCRNKWKKKMLVGSWSSLNWYFFFFVRVEEGFCPPFFFTL